MLKGLLSTLFAVVGTVAIGAAIDTSGNPVTLNTDMGDIDMAATKVGDFKDVVTPNYNAVSNAAMGAVEQAKSYTDAATNAIDRIDLGSGPGKAAYADVADYATEANYAMSAEVASSADYATSAGYSDSSETAGYAEQAGTANAAASAGTADTAGTADYADESGLSYYTKGISAGNAILNEQEVEHIFLSYQSWFAQATNYTDSATNEIPRITEGTTQGWAANADYAYEAGQTTKIIDEGFASGFIHLGDLIFGGYKDFNQNDDYINYLGFGIDGFAFWSFPTAQETTNIVNAIVDYSQANTSLVATVQATAPRPGNYNSVSNAAMTVQAGLTNMTLAGYGWPFGTWSNNHPELLLTLPEFTNSLWRYTATNSSGQVVGTARWIESPDGDSAVELRDTLNGTNIVFTRTGTADYTNSLGLATLSNLKQYVKHTQLDNTLSGYVTNKKLDSYDASYKIVEGISTENQTIQLVMYTNSVAQPLNIMLPTNGRCKDWIVYVLSEVDLPITLPAASYWVKSEAVTNSIAAGTPTALYFSQISSEGIFTIGRQEYVPLTISGSRSQSKIDIMNGIISSKRKKTARTIKTRSIKR